MPKGAKMLVDFTVENYRSIREPVTLSLVAQGKTRKTTATKNRPRIRPDQEIAPSVPVEGRGIELLPGLGIFGANASGKSNVLRALGNLLEFIQVGGVGRTGSSIPVRFPPFKLDQTSSHLPARFEFRAAVGGAIYTYGLEIDRIRILRERLEFIPSLRKRSQSRLVFERKWLQELKEFHIKNGPDLGEGYHEIQKSLQDYEPFLSLLTRLNVGVVRELIDWLKASWLDLSLGREELNGLLNRIVLAADPDLLNEATRMVRVFDTGISRIEVKEPDAESPVGTGYKVSVEHKVNGTQVLWGIEEESAGTQRLFSLSGNLLGALRSGSLVLVDELSSSIHPNIARAIVRLFQSEKANPKRAQLIFTSHDNTLQRGNLLRRDQIWFTQKRNDGSTNLYPLTDFRPRNDLALDKAYLDGRFGAVPIIPSDEDLIAALETSD
jgi:AAA15 family ATPase/GTPase